VFGFLNIHKPPGPTSHDVVAGVRRTLDRRVKVGHAGTLDPFAAGVLVLCVGPATRLASYVQALPKRYVAEIALGNTSATDDPQGPITETQGATPPTADAVGQAVSQRVGQIRQVPPAHSAVHVSGRRAYQLARAGQDVSLTPRTVTVHAIEVLRYDWPRLEIDVRCGSGTYIRALARDLGAALGVGGYCAALTRTNVGPFRADEAVAPDRLDLDRDLQSPLIALAGLPKRVADESAVRALAMGQAVALAACPPCPSAAAPATAAPGDEVIVTDARDRLVAIATLGPSGQTLRPAKVFVSA